MKISEDKKNISIWEKKVIVSYFLAVLIFWKHCSCFDIYAVDGTWAKYISIFFMRFFNPICVPLFFIISGAFFFRDYTNNKYWSKLRRRIYSLLIPFLLWNIINMLFDIVASYYFSQYFTEREVFRFSVRNFLEGIFLYKYNGPFWFVFALFIFSLATPIIDKFLCNKWISVIFILLIALGTQFGIGLPTYFFHTQSCIVFYLFGAFIGKYYFANFSKVKNNKQMTVISASVMLMYCLSRILNICGIYEVITIINELTLCAASLSLWCLFNLICTKIRARKFMNHSFWVYALHINVGVVIANILKIVLPKNVCFSIVNFVLTTLITLALIEFLCFTTNKICRPLYLCLSGNRE